MKKFHSQLKNLFIIIVLFVNFGIVTHATEEKSELVFLNWDKYIDPELVKAFEAKFHVKLKPVYFETDETRTELLLTTDGKGYDVAIVADSHIASYVKRGWLAPIEKSKLPNLRHVDSQWLESLGQTKRYVVPYLWGTLGIVHRKDLIKEEITSWKQLYQPSSAFQGKIVMINDSGELIGLALKSLGYSPNSSKKKELDAAKKLLLAQKPYVRAYEYPDMGKDSKLVTGEIWMAMMYNGDALALKDEHPQIVFTVPEEGSMLWCDYLVVMAGSQKKKLAMDFINFLTEPQNAARLSEYLQFASPNKSAEKLLPKEHLKNPLIYPTPAVLANSELFKTKKARVRKKWNAIYSKVIE